MAIIWDEARHVTGYLEIDLQHKELFDKVNKLTQAFEEDPSNSRRILELICFLQAYAVLHFCCEERIMEEKKCVVCPKNKSEHRSFLTSYREIRERFEREGASMDLVRDIQTRVAIWIDSHIAKTDTSIREVPQES